MSSVDLRLAGCNLYKNGELAGTGACGALLEAEAAGTDRVPITDEWPGLDLATSSAVQGHPAEALALAANYLGRRGLAVEPGWVVLTGGMTDAVDVPPGAVLAAHFTHLGSLFLP